MASQSSRWGVFRRFRLPPVHLLASVFCFLFPSFVVNPLKRLFLRKSLDKPPKPLSPTAYLDGLRGVAALVVYVFHFGYLWFPFLRHGWGISDEDRLFLQLPVIRAIHSGRSSVAVFFVISGYVLSISTLAKIHGVQMERVLSTLPGAVFRRPLRLYLPILVATFLIALSMRIPTMIPAPNGGGGVPPRFETLQEQMVDWAYSMVDVVNPFRVIVAREALYSPRYDGHLWTIPVEFKGSLMVFVLLLGYAMSKRWVHMLVIMVVMIWQGNNGDMDMVLFCAGLFLAELSFIVPVSSPIWTPFRSAWGKRIVVIMRHITTLSLFVVGMHLLSYPENGGIQAPGFRHLSIWVPQYYRNNEWRIQHFWNAIGAIIFVIALMYSPPLRLPAFNFRRLLFWSRSRGYTPISDPEKVEAELSMPLMAEDDSSQTEGSEHSTEPRPELEIEEPGRPLLQRIFTCGFSQYLGAISYPLYLAHGTVNHSIGMRWLIPALAALAQEQAAAAAVESSEAKDDMLAAAWSKYMWSSVPAITINTIALFWVSDVFMRAVDIPAVRLTRRINGWASR